MTSDDHQHPPFPADLAPFAPVALRTATTAPEFGAIYLLCTAAWVQDRPGTLANDDTLLAAIARMRPEEWTPARPRLLLDFTPDETGRLVNRAIVKAFERIAADAESRRRRTAAASSARWASTGGGGRVSVTDPSRIRNASVTDPSRTLRSESSASASASSRPVGQDESKRPAGRSETGRVESAVDQRDGGTRTLEPENPLLAQLRDAERAVVRRLLSAAEFSWAGYRHSKVPPTVLEQMVAHPNATIRQVEWALAWARRLAFEPDNQAAGYNPIGRIITAIRKNKIPDLWFSKEYDARVDREDRRLEALRRKVLALPPTNFSLANGGAS